MRVPGVSAIPLIVFTWMAAHYLMYTCIVPFLHQGGTGLAPDAALFVFGIAALVGIWLTGVFADRALRTITLIGAALMVLAGAGLWPLAGSLPAIIPALVLWGVSFGGAATQVQMAITIATGPTAELAITLLTAVFNLSIFAADAGGSPVLDFLGPAVLPLVLALLMLAAFGMVLAGKRAAFPPSRRAPPATRPNGAMTPCCTAVARRRAPLPPGHPGAAAAPSRQNPGSSSGAQVLAGRGAG